MVDRALHSRSRTSASWATSTATVRRTWLAIRVMLEFGLSLFQTAVDGGRSLGAEGRKLQCRSQTRAQRAQRAPWLETQSRLAARWLLGQFQFPQGAGEYD